MDKIIIEFEDGGRISYNTRFLRNFSVGYTEIEHDRLVEKYALRSDTVFNKEKMEWDYKPTPPIDAHNKLGAYEGYYADNTVWYHRDMGRKFINFEIPLTGTSKIYNSLWKYERENIKHLTEGEKDALIEKINTSWIEMGV